MTEVFCLPAFSWSLFSFFRSLAYITAPLLHRRGRGRTEKERYLTTVGSGDVGDSFHFSCPSERLREIPCNAYYKLFLTVQMHSNASARSSSLLPMLLCFSLSSRRRCPIPFLLQKCTSRRLCVCASSVKGEIGRSDGRTLGIRSPQTPTPRKTTKAGNGKISWI